jgi:hypothetical protein
MVSFKPLFCWATVREKMRDLTPSSHVVNNSGIHTTARGTAMAMYWHSGSTGRVVDMFVVRVLHDVRGTKCDRLRNKVYKFHSKSPWDSYSRERERERVNDQVWWTSSAYFNVYKSQTSALLHVWARRINFTPFLLISNKVLYFNIIFYRRLGIPRFLFSWGFSIRFPYAFLMFS